MSGTSRQLALACLCAISAFTGCSDQDAANLKKVSVKAWNRATSLAEDTRDKLKAGMQKKEDRGQKTEDSEVKTESAIR